MLKFVIRALVVLFVLYFTPFGGFVRPYFTSRSQWFEGIELSGTGTGFYINENNVITNNHVIDGCDRIVVGGKDKRVSNATVITTDGANDLAVLKTASRVATILYISDGSGIGMGKEVVFPDYSSEQGEFALDYKTIKKLDDGNIYASVGLRFGNSGSPLMDEYGRVVGVNKAWQGGEGVLGFFMLTGYTVATNQSRLVEFLGKHNIAFNMYHAQPAHLLKEATYKDYVAVNIGCHKNGAWFTH